LISPTSMEQYSPNTETEESSLDSFHLCSPLQDLNVSRRKSAGTEEQCKKFQESMRTMTTASGSDRWISQRSLKFNDSDQPLPFEMPHDNELQRKCVSNHGSGTSLYLPRFPKRQKSKEKSFLRDNSYTVEESKRLSSSHGGCHSSEEDGSKGRRCDEGVHYPELVFDYDSGSISSLDEPSLSDDDSPKRFRMKANKSVPRLPLRKNSKPRLPIRQKTKGEDGEKSQRLFSNPQIKSRRKVERSNRNSAQKMKPIPANPFLPPIRLTCSGKAA